MAEAIHTLDDDRERWFRRALAVSAAAHALLLLLATISPFPRGRTHALPGVVSVTLVAAPPGAAKPAAKPPAPAAKPKPPKEEAKPKEEPKPVPPPEPAKPEVKADKKVLPKEATKPPKPEPPKPKPAVAPPEPPEPLDYEDALTRLRNELGEAPPEEAPDPELLASVRPAERAGPPGGGAPGEPVSPEEAAWRRRVKIHVTKAWVLQPNFRRQALETEVTVKLGATGEVLDVDVSRRSGNPWYDESVVRAIEKASPLPQPPEDGEWPFVFTPQDLL